MNELWLFLGAASLYVIASVQVLTRYRDARDVAKHDHANAVMETLGENYQTFIAAHKKSQTETEAYRLQHDQWHIKLDSDLHRHMKQERAVEPEVVKQS